MSTLDERDPIENDAIEAAAQGGQENGSIGFGVGQNARKF